MAHEDAVELGDHIEGEGAGDGEDTTCVEEIPLLVVHLWPRCWLDWLVRCVDRILEYGF